MQLGDLVLDEEVRSGCRTLMLTGELDRGTVAALQRALRRACAAGEEELVLDLHQLSFVDSTGLRSFLWAKALCEEYGCTLLMTGAQRHIERLFELTGLSHELPLRQAGSA